MLVAVLNFICIAGVFAGGGTSPNPWQDPDSYSDGGDDNSTTRFYSEGELVVKLTGDSISIGEINGLFGTEVKQFLPQLEIFLLSVEEGVDLEFLAATIDSLPSVIYAHPNYLVDPLQPVQGSFPISDENLHGEYELQWAADALALADAHGFSKGGGVKVAVIDGGVDYTHQAFNGMAVSGYDYVDEDYDAFDEPGGDNSGHGTYVAGIIHRVAPEAEIRAYRVSEISGDSHGYLVAEAILQAIEDGCQVINLSLVMMNEHSAIAAAIGYARNRDVIVAVAAGNLQEYSPLYPASDGSVIAVAATDSLSLLADFSRYGTHVDVCAPGADIFSPYQDGLYAWWSGTSFAAPFVAGQAALLISHMMPDYSWETVKNAIIYTANNLDELNPAFAGLLGEGLIDPVGALSEDTVVDEPRAFVHRDSVDYVFDEGYAGVDTGWVYIVSENAPAPFTVSLVGTPVFLELLTDSGMTDETVYFTINLDGSLPAGNYCDTMLFEVEGVINNPVLAPVWISIVPDVQRDSAWIHPRTLDLYIEEGEAAVDTFCFDIYSTNAPASYTVYPLNELSFITLLGSPTGYTNDRICFVSDPRGLEPGVYSDTLYFEVEGIIQWIGYYVATVAIRPAGAPPDSAYLSPDTLFFTAQEGTYSYLTGYSLLSSTNAPANFTATRDSSATHYLGLITFSGQTNDSVGVSVVPSLAGGAGVYHTFVVYDVDGVEDPVFLYIVLTIEPSSPPTDMAFLSPDTLFFYAEEGTYQILTGYSFLSSTNAPADFTATEDPSASHYLDLLTSSGQTNDSVGVLVIPSEAGGVGVYNTFVEYQVNGVDDPVYLTIILIIDTVSPPPDMAFLSPDTLFFTAYEGENLELVGYSCLSSTNAPAAYEAEIDTSCFVATLIDTAGETNDSVGVIVNTDMLGLGVYYCFAMYSVEGVEDPVFLHIILRIESSSPPLDTAFLSPDTLFFTAQEGTYEILTGYSYLSSTNAPADFTAYLPPSFSFYLGLLTFSGQTNDSVGIYLVPSEAGGAGVYNAFVEYQVDGVEEPAFLYIILTIESSSPPLDTAFVSPDTLFFTAFEGEDVELVGYSYLSSTNAPAAYHAKIDTNCVVATLIDTAGETNDSVGVRVNTGMLGAGVYYCFAMYFVDSVENLPILQIVLTIQPADSLPPPGSTAPLSLDNVPNPFNLRTNIRFTLAAASEVNLSIYNLLGQKVITLVNRELPPGDHVITWDGNSSSGIPAASGIYFYRIEAGDIVETKKMLLLK
jgi:thermitase